MRIYSVEMSNDKDVTIAREVAFRLLTASLCISEN